MKNCKTSTYLSSLSEEKNGAKYIIEAAILIVPKPIKTKPVFSGLFFWVKKTAAIEIVVNEKSKRWVYILSIPSCSKKNPWKNHTRTV